MNHAILGVITGTIIFAIFSVLGMAHVVETNNLFVYAIAYFIIRICVDLILTNKINYTETVIVVVSSALTIDVLRTVM